MGNVSEPAPISERFLWKLFTRFKTSSAVFPLEPIAPANSEFFKIDPQRRIRVICFPLKNEESTALTTEDRCSWTEDYWFTRWTKPLKQINIKTENPTAPQTTDTGGSRRSGCSFRRQCSALPITDCERYIEHLVSRSIAEVLRELAQLRPSCGQLHSGVDNAAYLQEGDDHANVHNVTDEDTGPPASRRVVLLYHGIGSGADTWRAIGEALASRGYRVLAPDMLGHGYSSTPDRPALYTFDSLLADALRLYDHYTTDADKCILIGHSYGCSLVAAMARVRTDRTVQLVLVSGGGPTPLCAVSSGGGGGVAGAAWRLVRSVLVAPLLVCGVRRQRFYPPRGKQHRPCPAQPAPVPAHVLRYVVRGQSWPQGDAALHRRILVPTLLVHGTLDDRVTLVQQCEMERTIPRAFLELLPDTGHMAMLENPEHLSHMILCFMDWWHR